MLRIDNLRKFLSSKKKEFEEHEKMGKNLEYRDVEVLIDTITKALKPIEEEHEQVKEGLKKLLRMIEKKSD